jgi:molybdopterin-guanine dinucleotide biosynthesis protein A
LHAARGLLHQGRRSVHALYEILGAQQLSASQLPDPRVLQTCNTPEAWHAAKATLERRGAP